MSLIGFLDQLFDKAVDSTNNNTMTSNAKFEAEWVKYFSYLISYILR